MQALKPCPYRRVDNDGHILCSQIKSGDCQVTADTCRMCPIAEIDCIHLRASLCQPSRTPLTVRWGNGKTAIWDAPAPPITLELAACSAKTIPIYSSLDCVGCAIRQVFVTAPAPFQTSDRQRLRISKEQSTPTTQTGSVVARKIIQLQKWLDKQKKATEDEPEIQPIAIRMRSAHAVGEEKHVGWTD